MMENRTRCREIKYRLTEDEYIAFKTAVARTGLTQQAFLESLISGAKITELPHPDFYNVINLLQNIDVNIEQIAAFAFPDGDIDKRKLWDEIEKLESVISEIKSLIMQ